MNEVSIFVSGEPVAQGRPRFTTIGGHPHAIDPPKSRDFKHLIRMEAENAMGIEDPMLGDVEVLIKVFRLVPRSFSKTKTRLALAGELRPVTKPDVDNYAKAALDGLSRLVYQDDAQIVRLEVEKYYADKPGMSITVRRAAHDVR